MSLLNNKDNKKVVENMTYDDYDNEPIDSFGKNMLLKMGWRENQSVNGKEPVKPFELKPRHYRLGLGATPLDPTKNVVKYTEAEKEKKEREKNFFGAKVKITHGKHKGLKAIIAEKIVCEDLSEYLKKNDFIKIELKINKEVFKIETKNIRLRSCKKRDRSQEYKHRDKNAHKKDKSKSKKHKKSRKHSSSDYSNSSSESSRFNTKDHKNEKFNSIPICYNNINEKKTSSYYEAQAIEDNRLLNKKTGRDGNNQINTNYLAEENFNKTMIGKSQISDKQRKKHQWVMQNILVRITNKRNKYYNTQANVMDLPSSEKITLLTNDGILIENLTENDIETVIPDLGERMIILKGNEKGEFGELMFFDNENETLTVQLMSDFSIKTYKKNECSAIGNS